MNAAAWAGYGSGVATMSIGAALMLGETYAFGAVFVATGALLVAWGRWRSKHPEEET